MALLRSAPLFVPVVCVAAARLRSANSASESAEKRFKFDESQLFKPSKPYPEWDKNWDFREDKTSSKKPGAKPGPNRHIILVRHGQYDETYDDDARRILTPLGRQQAVATGKRLATMLASAKGAAEGKVVCRLHVSSMARAQETATIIGAALPAEVQVLPPNPLLSEGRPCHVVPEGRKEGKPAMSPKSVHLDGPRIEAGFRQLFHRASPRSAARDRALEKHESCFKVPFDPRRQHDMMSVGAAENDDDDDDEEAHEYDIVVCHGNVIRYMALRALQLPPEGWLRLCTFNCSLTYLVVRPGGSVSLRTLGDIGHLDTNLVTFSGHHGLEW